ncbi:hypothetical protein F2P81_024438 [Scophthalmus maximus]|uniref:Uncharacterized protein n=1 Tax=Scophthalmus maximus TaxID=52904 RepID=A0A6A4RUV3_SCOMX|nr:hypothetical protein F2P81_024438 [Scophthalmus maximus]
MNVASENQINADALKNKYNVSMSLSCRVNLFIDASKLKSKIVQRQFSKETPATVPTALYEQVEPKGKTPNLSLPTSDLCAAIETTRPTRRDSGGRHRAVCRITQWTVVVKRKQKVDSHIASTFGHEPGNVELPYILNGPRFLPYKEGAQSQRPNGRYSWPNTNINTGACGTRTDFGSSRQISASLSSSRRVFSASKNPPPAPLFIHLFIYLFICFRDEPCSVSVSPPPTHRLLPPLL